MKASKVATSTARRIFRLCQENGEIHEDRLRGVIERLGKEKPRDYLSMLQVLRRLVVTKLASRRVQVQSAVSLSKPEQEAVTSDLKKKHGDKIDVEFSENAELLGGLRIQVGDTVYDSSVQARLSRLAESF